MINIHKLTAKAILLGLYGAKNSKPYIIIIIIIIINTLRVKRIHNYNFSLVDVGIMKFS
jgi:hypothetical protein